MRLLMKRSAAAVVAAFFLVVLVGDLPLLAQRDYKGDLFWMADPSPAPGALWVAPPLRGWSPEGNPWSAATSFPPRVWEYQVSDAPPTDPCVQLPLDPAAFDSATGPFGMQLSTYFAEWWEGTTYRAHPNKPPGYRPDLFGFFDFRHGRRPDRPRVGSGGVPGRAIGNPGACAAATLAALQGGGDSQWMPHQRDGYGNPCLSTAHLFRLRVNMETRCEPDLRYRDAFTERFWQMFDVTSAPTLPNGESAPVLFPADFLTDPNRPWIGRGFIRRVDLAVDRWIHADGEEPVQNVFNVDLPSAFGAVARYRPEYLEYHNWRLTGTRDSRRDSPWNPFRQLQPGGGPPLDWIQIVDTVNGTADCVALDTYHYEPVDPGTPYDLGGPSPCDGYVPPPGYVAGDSYANLGAGSPQEVADVLADAVPMLPRADGHRRPFPVDDTFFWMEWDTFSFRCQTGVAAIGRLAHAARNSITQHMYWYRTSYAEYERALADGRLQQASRFLANAKAYRGWAQGWDAIRRYREQAHTEMYDALSAAGYRMGVYRLEVAFDGGPPSECAGTTMTLQPIEALPQRLARAPAGGLPQGSLLGMQDSVQMFGPTQRRPHYAKNLGRLRTVPLSHSNYAELPPGSQMPSGVTHWNGLDVTDSPGFYLPLSCPVPEANVFAPAIAELPIYSQRKPDGSMHWVEHEKSDSIANYTECADERYGAGDCYASPVLQADLARYGDTRTLRAVKAHVAAGPQGWYAADAFRREGSASELGTQVNRFVRTSSGDVDDAGNRISFESHRTERAVSYEVATDRIQIELDLPYRSIDSGPLGLGDLDYRNGGPMGGGNRLTVTESYWGIAPGTVPSDRPPDYDAVPDQETMTRRGPIRFIGAAELSRTFRVGTCTLCSEFGCSEEVTEHFPDERFTSSVSQGTIVCLLQRGLTPPQDCPGP